MQNQIIGPALASKGKRPKAPLFMKLMQWPLLRGIPGRLLAFGAPGAYPYPCCMMVRTCIETHAGEVGSSTFFLRTEWAANAARGEDRIRQPGGYAPTFCLRLLELRVRKSPTNDECRAEPR